VGDGYDSREASIGQYEIFIRKKILEDPVTYNLDWLMGKRLGCWCKPAACHGDVLVRLCSEKSCGGRDNLAKAG
jgi:hypothetical protein